MGSEDYQNMMRSILYEWDGSIFFYGSDTSLAGYTDEQYKLMGYECKKYFQTDTFFDEFELGSVENLGSFDGVGKKLTKEDKELLILYSDYLFDGIKEEKKVYRYMLKLALYLNRYRYLGTRKNIVKKIHTSGIKKPKKHYTEAQKTKKIKETAEFLILLMGGRFVSHGLIIDELKKVIESPHLYIYKPPNPKALFVAKIQSYLSNLKLKKQVEIKNFITDISNV